MSLYPSFWVGDFSKKCFLKNDILYWANDSSRLAVKNLCGQPSSSLLWDPLVTQTIMVIKTGLFSGILCFLMKSHEISSVPESPILL